MSRVLKFVIGLGAICAVGIVVYAIQPDWFAHRYQEWKPQKGVSGHPKSAKDLAGTYYRGDGTGYNVYLSLKPDDTYSATWLGCLGTYGEASGEWHLADDHILFHASRETGMMRGHLKDLAILRFRDYWIFLPTDKAARSSYDEFGVSRFSCYQNTNSIYPGP